MSLMQLPESRDSFARGRRLSLCLRSEKFGSACAGYSSCTTSKTSQIICLFNLSSVCFYMHKMVHVPAFPSTGVAIQVPLGGTALAKWTRNKISIGVTPACACVFTKNHSSLYVSLEQRETRSTQSAGSVDFSMLINNADLQSSKNSSEACS